MRLKTVITGALVCATATAVLASVAPARPLRPNPGVYVAQCDKVERSAAFVGSMRALKDTDRMWMRFTLLERILPGKDLEPLSVPELEAWHKSRPGVKRFSFRQRVRALEKAAIYKVEGEFRWYDEEGALVRQAIERSPRCRQPGALPNLRIQRIGRRPSGQYSVRVGNVGRDLATGASVQLFVDGQDVGMAALPDIVPDEVRATLFNGPDCQGSVQAVVDPTASLRESAEDDNALTVPCAELD